MIYCTQRTKIKAMLKKDKFSLEIPIRCSPSILYEFLATPNGLGEWFADHVEQNGKQFTFKWSNSSDVAIQLEAHENKSVKFRWDYMPANEYFEFKVEQNDVTRETLLTITDFADKIELKSQIALWEQQINDLKHRIGS
jgi:uncharacterized protein YndB with AHSA1/START domain